MQLRSHAQKYTRVQIIHMCIIYIPQTIRKLPDTPHKSGEICFGLMKYFNFFLINMFKFLQKYKNVW